MAQDRNVLNSVEKGEAQPTCSLAVNELSSYTQRTHKSLPLTLVPDKGFEQNEVVTVFDKPYITIFASLS